MTRAKGFDYAKKFKAAYNKVEAVQLELAEWAYLAIDGEGLKPAEFAREAGVTVDTIRKYRRVHLYVLENPAHGLGFADIYVMANSSLEQQAAIHMVADDNGTAIGTAKSKTQEVAYYREIFNTVDPSLLKEVLEDEHTRHRLRDLSVKAVMDNQPPPKKDAMLEKDRAVRAQPLTPEVRSQQVKLERAMSELMHTNRSTQTRFITAMDAFVAAVPNQFWDRRFSGETVHRSHGEQVLGDLEKTIRILQEQLARAKVAVAEANVDAEERHERDLERAES